jgi:hypothetical protein
MTSEQVILEKIEHLYQTMQDQGRDIGEIKKTVSLIAVQSNRIDNLSGQVQELWIVRKEHADKLNEVQKFQASCPRGTIEKDIQAIRDNVGDSIRNQWVAIGILATALIAMAGWVKFGG